MIQQNLVKFKELVKLNLDPRRLKIDGQNYVLPDKDSLNNPALQYEFIYSVYLTLLEGYATNVLKDAKFELQAEIRSFMDMPIDDVDKQYMINFITCVLQDKSDFMSKYYGFFEGTCWSFGDLAGCALRLIS